MEILDALMAANIDLSRAEGLMRNLVTLVAARGREPEITSALTRLAKASATAPAHAPWQISAFAQFLQEFEATKRPLEDFKSATAALPDMLASARQLAANDAQSIEHRVSAVNLLGRDPAGQSDDATLLVVLLSPRTPDSLQRAALGRLGQMRSKVVPAALAKGWSGYSPSVRAQALDLLLRREEWTRALLERLEAKELAVEDLGAGARQRLLSYPSDGLRERARRLLAQPVNPERQKLIEQFLPVVQKASGNPTRGAAHFAQHCAACHRLNQQGTGAALDLATVVDRSPERMLTAILDPNRAVEERYLNYVMRTKAGDEFSGMLTGESANSITLVGASGARETLLRSDIESLASTRLSIMPEGFEQFLQPLDLADLLAFLDTATAPPRGFPGNRPAVVKVDADGALRLRAANAEIHGDGIAFESQYKNLGSWNSVDARAVWTVQVPVAGAYDVWLHWACHENEAGDTFHFQLGDAAFSAKVPVTGTWDIYKAEKFARLNLPADEQRAVFQAEAPLRAYLIDLLEVRLVPVTAQSSPKFEDVSPARTAAAPAAAPK
jgi:putative heme-binding domain-containing protein